jgi:hypothetical protein
MGMEYVHRAGAKVHHDNPEIVFPLSDNVLHAYFTPEDFVGTFIPGFYITNPHYLHYSPPKTSLESG